MEEQYGQINHFFTYLDSVKENGIMNIDYSWTQFINGYGSWDKERELENELLQSEYDIRIIKKGNRKYIRVVF